MLFRNRTIIHLESVDSTNNYAANLLKVSNPPEGTVITAQEQTEGRGQRGAIWESEKGMNLQCSFITYPSFLSSQSLFDFSKVVSIAVADVLEDQLQREVKIKWPNDLIAEGNKIGGMLIEYIWLNQKVQSAITGIGINVNQIEFSQPRATSLKRILGKTIDVWKFLDLLLISFDRQYLKLQTGFYSEIDHEYRTRLYKLGEVNSYVYRDELIKAIIEGVDQTGKLRLRLPTNELITCDLKEVTMIY